MKESDPDSLISYVNQSLMTDTDGMKELDGFSFGLKAPEGLQPKGFESIPFQYYWVCVTACLMRNILIGLLKVIHQTLIKGGLLMK